MYPLLNVTNLDHLQLCLLHLVHRNAVEIYPYIDKVIYTYVALRIFDIIVKPKIKYYAKYHCIVQNITNKQSRFIRLSTDANCITVKEIKPLKLHHDIVEAINIILTFPIPMPYLQAGNIRVLTYCRIYRQNLIYLRSPQRS